MASVKKETEERRSRADRRGYGRVPVTFKVEVLFGGNAIEVIVDNVSLGGILFHTGYPFSLGDTMIIVFSGSYNGIVFNERVPGKIVTLSRRENQNAYGVQFMTALYKEKYPSLTSFVDRGRRKEVSFLRDPQYEKAERKD